MDDIRLLINEPSIGLTDRTAYLFRSGSSYSLTAGQRGTATLVFRIFAGDTYMPVTGCPVFWQTVLGGTPSTRFAGTVDNVELKTIGNDGDRFVTVTLVSLEQCFDTIRVGVRSYAAGTKWGAVIADLLATVCAGVPVSAGTISDGATLTAELVLTDADAVSDVFSNGATQSGYVWYVEPTTATLEFHAPSTVASPVTLGSTDIEWSSIDWKQTRQDFRNRQIVQMSMQGAPVSHEHISTGAVPTTSYALAEKIDTLLSAKVTLNAHPGTVPLIFSGIPAANDTVAIAVLPLTAGDVAYKYVTTLDNTQPGQVLRGASAAASASNLADAVNAVVAQAGLTYSLPTRENRGANATYTSGPSVSIDLKSWGSAGAAWLVGTPYTVGEIVIYGVTYYIAMASSTGVTPGTDATKWQVTTNNPLAVTISSSVIQNSFIRSITIDHTKCGTADSVNFPLYVFISDATFKSIANGGNVTSNVGNDIQFWSNSSATAALLWEIDYYDPVNGILYAWVKIPTLSHTTNTVIYVTYGNPAITGPTSSTPFLFADGACNVFHLRGPAATAAGFGAFTKNSGGSGNDLTNHSAVATDSGLLDGCGTFNGSSQYLDIVTPTVMGYMISAWVKPASASGTHVVVNLGDGEFQLFSQGANWVVDVLPRDGGYAAVSTGTVATGVWQHVVGVLDLTVSGPEGNGLLRIWVNGVQGTDGDPESTDQGGPSLSVGGGPRGYCFSGAIDEVHTRVGTPTQSWVTAEYNNQSAPGTFFTLGAQSGIAASFSSGADATSTLALNIGTDITATRGSSSITLANAPAANHVLDVTYYRLGADFVRVEDSALVATRAAIEHGSGRYQAIMSDTANTDYWAVLAKAQNALAKYSVLPDVFTFSTYANGLAPGQWLTVAVVDPIGAGALLNGTWQLQSVRAQYMPAQAGMSPGSGCFLYQITATSSTMPGWISWWEQLAKG